MKKLLYTTIAILSFANFTMAQVPSYVPTDSLKGWWGFNSNANDQSGKGNNGTVNGATLTTDRFGNANSSYNFNGNQQNIVLNNLTSALTKGITISYWIKIPNNGGGTAIVQCNPTPPNYSPTFQITHSNTLQHNLISNSCSNTSGLWDTTNNISGFWHHIIVSVDNLNFTNKLYIDGLLTKSTQSFNFTNCSNSNSTLRIGGQWLNADAQWFIGQIDDIGIWNRALTQTEISNLYNANLCYQTITVTDTLVINVNRTGYNPITYSNTLKVYPNPTKDRITIDNGDITKMSGCSIKIFNSLGQQKFQSAINQQQFTIDITQWGGNGLYFLNLLDASGNIIDVKKILLN